MWKQDKNIYIYIHSNTILKFQSKTCIKFLLADTNILFYESRTYNEKRISSKKIRYKNRIFKKSFSLKCQHSTYRRVLYIYIKKEIYQSDKTDLKVRN